VADFLASASSIGRIQPIWLEIRPTGTARWTQKQFAHIVHKFERLRAQQREAERQAEHLFQALLHRAFRGEV
jgi:hypothetical protein